MNLEDLIKRWRAEAARLRRHGDHKSKELTRTESAVLAEHAQVLELCATELVNLL